MKTTGKYMIYKFVNTKTNEEVKVFFQPDGGSIRKFTNRHRQLNDYLANDFEIMGVVYVSEEVYLNERLNKTIFDYQSTFRGEMEARRNYEDHLIPREVYIDTIKLCRDFEWTCLKIIDKQLGRLEDKSYRVNNPDAYSLRTRYHQMLCL